VGMDKQQECRTDSPDDDGNRTHDMDMAGHEDQARSNGATRSWLARCGGVGARQLASVDRRRNENLSHPPSFLPPSHDGMGAHVRSRYAPGLGAWPWLLAAAASLWLIRGNLPNFCCHVLMLFVLGEVSL
jgi:hypothetical protein